MSDIKSFISRFGFHTLPFTCEISTEKYFCSDIYKESLEHLYRAVEKRMSAALIAPAGSGKTALLRSLAKKLPQTRYNIHYIKVTDLSKRDFCYEISNAIGIESARNYPSLVRRLQERFTGSLDIDGLRPTLILDEAHDMRPDVLGILRILTNFEMDSRLVVSVIIAGQAPLKKMLEHPKLEDVATRLNHYATLRLLSRTEIFQYVQHRCQVAGAHTCPFDQSAQDALYEIGRGNLRATDHLSLKSLELAHDQKYDVVDGTCVSQAKGMLWN
jgi:general secretion pathway protein A